MHQGAGGGGREGGRWRREVEEREQPEIGADIHLDALSKEKRKEKGKDPEARARGGEQCVIMVAKATACGPRWKGRGLEEGHTAEVQPAKSTLMCWVPGGVGVEEM